MADVVVDFDALRQNAARLGAVHDAVVKELGAVSVSMGDLEANGFSTPTASAAFQRLFAEWKARATDLLETMRDTSDAMTSAAEVHERSDQQHAAAARTAIVGAAGVGAAGRAAAVGKDPGYSVVPGNQATERFRQIDVAKDVRWGRQHGGGDRYAYDQVPGPKGQPITRTQGMQTTVTRDMLRAGKRTTSPPPALKDVMPGYDSRHQLQLGHLWADRLGGPNAARNFVPVHAHTNGGGMAYVEGRVAAAVEQHGRVRLVAFPRYVGDEPIPREILYAWKAPGDSSWTAVNIRNLP